MDVRLNTLICTLSKLMDELKKIAENPEYENFNSVLALLDEDSKSDADYLQLLLAKMTSLPEFDIIISQHMFNIDRKIELKKMVREIMDEIKNNFVDPYERSVLAKQQESKN